jgi:hypothetical protein
VNQVKDLRENAYRRLSGGILSCGLNRDIVPRTTTANNGSWSSGELQGGESWEMVVGVSGVRDYFCEFHPDMKGVLEVRLVLTRILFVAMKRVGRTCRNFRYHF